MSIVEIDVEKTVTKKVKKVVCDRCDQIIDDQKFSYYADAWEGSVSITVDHRNQGGASSYKYDLCDPCSKNLKQWIEGA